MGHFVLNEDLSKYVDSLLFDYTQKPIASYCDDKYLIELVIIGAVQIHDMKLGHTYYHPIEFSDSLVQDIKSGRVYSDDRRYIDEYNEFAYAVSKKKESAVYKIPDNGIYTKLQVDSAIYSFKDEYEFLDYERLGESIFTSNVSKVSQLTPEQLVAEMKYMISLYYESYE